MDHLLQLQKNIDDMKSTFSSQMETFKSSLATRGSGADDLATQFVAFQDMVWKAVESLQAQMGFVLKTLEEMETRSRAGILLLHGVPEADDEDATTTAVRIVQRSLKFDQMSPLSLLTCYRLGNKHTPTKPRPLLLKFACLRARNTVWASKKLLKGSGHTLSEFLTSSRHAVFLEARSRYGVRGSWTSDGRIVVQCHDGVRRKVTSMAELQALPPPEAETQVRGQTEVQQPATEAGTAAPEVASQNDEPQPGPSRRRKATRAAATGKNPRSRSVVPSD